MFLQVRGCCCALHTFVRILCIILVLVYLVASFCVILWRSLMTYPGAVNNAEHDGDTAASNTAHVIIFILVLIFSGIGVAVNLLVLVAIRMNRRSLILPWLVFQFMVILGKKY